jgi:hypothetical protein
MMQASANDEIGLHRQNDPPPPRNRRLPYGCVSWHSCKARNMPIILARVKLLPDPEGVVGPLAGSVWFILYSLVGGFEVVMELLR